MNKRPTPETDALWHKMNTGNSQPSWWVAAERMRDHSKQMERERDEAREELSDIRLNLGADAEGYTLLYAVCAIQKERDDARESLKHITE